MALSEAKWYKIYLREVCEGDENSELIAKKPVPTQWASYFLSTFTLDAKRGKAFATRQAKEMLRVMSDGLTTLQELILSNDVETATIQIEKEQERSIQDGDEERGLMNLKADKSALIYALLTGNLEMVRLVLKYGAGAHVNLGDFVTGFTPFHLAVFIESAPIMWELMSHGATLTGRDKFGGSALDYARMLQLLPPRNLFKGKSITYYNKESNKIESWTVKQFEETFKVTWCPHPLCSFLYVEELLFSGMQVTSKDLEFRKKYATIMETTSGDENVVVAKINDKIGYGLYAKKKFVEGDFIIKYGARVVKGSEQRNRSYAVTSGVEDMILDASEYRNLAALANHSKTPNAQAECIMDKGAEQAVFIATKDIEPGQQILINYGPSFGGALKSFVDMDTLSAADDFPRSLPKNITKDLSS